MFSVAFWFQDVEKCIAIMEDLAILPVNLTILKKNPDIMNTIKKVQCKVIDSLSKVFSLWSDIRPLNVLI